MVKLVNLSDLFDLQKVLDDRIVLEHPIQEKEDRLGKKFLALSVELYEWINELPETFKYWSNKKNKYEESLKEYVDGLHFILSIGLEIGFDTTQDIHVHYPTALLGDETVVGALHQKFMLFNALINKTYVYVENPNKHFRNEAYKDMLSAYLKLGEEVGYRFEDVVKFYKDKNEVNHERQNNNY
ncbi:dUTP diphosphatase [Bacillus cereus]|uniref:dUTP diphosphatase n=1 Tax=Bacillus cereus TaxID=1396 RepID=UPI003D17CC89